MNKHITEAKKNYDTLEGANNDKMHMGEPRRIYRDFPLTPWEAMLKGQEADEAAFNRYCSRDIRLIRAYHDVWVKLADECHSAFHDDPYGAEHPATIAYLYHLADDIIMKLHYTEADEMSELDFVSLAFDPTEAQIVWGLLQHIHIRHYRIDNGNHPIHMFGQYE
jgi:hypothetical protein